MYSPKAVYCMKHHPAGNVNKHTLVELKNTKLKKKKIDPMPKCSIRVKKKKSPVAYFDVLSSRKSAWRKHIGYQTHF
jgi:hypothetical protein